MVNGTIIKARGSVHGKKIIDNPAAYERVKPTEGAVESHSKPARMIERSAAAMPIAIILSLVLMLIHYAVNIAIHGCPLALGKTNRVTAKTIKPDPYSPIVPYPLAERVGFEPTLRKKRRPLFESGTMNHSDTSPRPKILPQSLV